jgi:nitric-oxide synthase, bacterial
MTTMTVTRSTPISLLEAADRDDLRAEAFAFLEQLGAELHLAPSATRERKAAVRVELACTGTYTHTPAELEYGAKLAWRNHTRCIGKLYWRTLVVRDRRQVSGTAAIRDQLVAHLRQAQNGGKIRPVITVFAPDTPSAAAPFILNDQLVRHAGYRRPDGSVLGDPAGADLTDRVRELGWSPGSGRFDVLPVAISHGAGRSEYVELPADVTRQLSIRHPCYPWFDDLGLRWYWFPTVSNLRLQIGGIVYPMAPFSGWYVSTEIGTRDLGDEDRYNLLPEVARRLGLDLSSNRTLWKDRALLELNVAVLDSFEQAGVRMVDHHTMADQFHRYTGVEGRAGRRVHGEWAWLIPPMSPSSTPTYHCSYDPTVLRPNFFRRAPTPA